MEVVRSLAAACGVASLVWACSSDSKTPAAVVAADGGADATTSGALVWTPCEDRFECTTVAVPIDYAAPDGAKIDIQLLKAKARKEDQRVGTVLVNPGGPGISMVEQLVDQYVRLALAFPIAMDRFDIVAFDWRGIGRSHPIKCVDDAFMEKLRAADLTLSDPSAVANVETLRQQFIAGCLQNGDQKLAPLIDTTHAARDMDRIRVALGEEKLNYLGFSYGTWLGATYASLFPDRVRAFALDAPVVLSADLGQHNARRAQTRDAGYARFFDACAAKPSCAFHPGENAAALAGHLDALAVKARTTGLPAQGRMLHSVDFSAAMSDGLRNASWDELAANLAAAEAGDATKLLEGADVAMGRKPDGTYDGRFTGLIAVSCLDLPYAPGTTVAQLQASVAAASSRSLGEITAPFPLCVDWPFKRSTPAPTLAASGAPPMLVVTSQHDPITIAGDGAAMVAALGNGSHLVTYEGDGHAAALHSACIRNLITAFLLDPQPPSATSCPAQ